MKHIRLTLTALLSLITLAAMSQSISRSQFAHYDLRKDSDSGTRSSKTDYIDFNPEMQDAEEGDMLFVQIIEAPQSWSDCNTYLHLESVGGAYDLVINGRYVASVEDSFSPAEYDITQYLARGENSIAMLVRPSALAALEQDVAKAAQPRFSGSYISNQNRLKIFDYITTIESEVGTDHARLHIDVIVENRFNFDETIEVGYDVYDPSGKLIEFNTSKVTLAGNSRDTVRFSPYLYGAAKQQWNSAKQPLYSVTLYTKANRVAQNYIPFKVGYKAERKAALKVAKYNAAATESSTITELRKLKKEGYNTVEPDYPQPLWYYQSCDKVGLYVIDKVAINAPTNITDRAVGGTPSNDPALLEEYLARVDKAYHRTRNFTSVIAYALGGESGNGYNMYKAYQRLKAVETERPIIYIGAAGEWNSDDLK